MPPRSSSALGCPSATNEFYVYPPVGSTSIGIHYRKQWLYRVPQALGKDQKTLGKGFTECNTRQTGHGIYRVGKQLFAESFLSRTRQMVCRVSNLTLGKKKWFAECFSKIHSAKDYCLPSVFEITLGKPIFQRKKNIFFLSIF